MSTPSTSLSGFTSPVHEELRAEVADFAAAVVAPRVAEMERSKAVDVELSRLIAERGWIGATIPVEYGGMGAGHLAKTIIIEELARVSGAMGAMVQASQLGVAKILHFGSPEQRRRWLPAVSEGGCLPTIAVTEPTSGSHVLGMAATAVRDGDEYVLNGRKVFVGNSHVADLHGVVMRTGLGSRGLSAFLVATGTPGLRLGEHVPALGLHGFSFGEVIFEDCRVPAANLLGREGDGLDVAYSSSVLYGRPNLTAVSLGVHRALVTATAAFAQVQQRYGAPLAALGAVAQKLGEMQSNVTTAEILAYHAVSLLDQGATCDGHLVNAKLANYELSMASARLAMEIHGASALLPQFQVERLVRDAHHMFAPAGTSDVQRVRLAEIALGKSKSEWSTRMAPLLRQRYGAAVVQAA